MKTVNDFYQEVAADAALQAEFEMALSQGVEAVLAFGKAHGCEATREEVLASLEEQNSSKELSELELDAVAGGKVSFTTVLISIASFATICVVASIGAEIAKKGGCKEAAG